MNKTKELKILTSQKRPCNKSENLTSQKRHCDKSENQKGSSKGNIQVIAICSHKNCRQMDRVITIGIRALHLNSIQIFLNNLKLLCANPIECPVILSI